MTRSFKLTARTSAAMAGFRWQPRIQSDHESAGIRLLGALAPLLAKGQIIIHGIMKRLE